MNRRDFLRATSGTVGVSAASAGATAQESPRTTTGTGIGTPTTAGADGTRTTPTGSPGPGTDGGSPATAQAGGAAAGEVEVPLVDFAFEGATESPLTIPPGTTVRFVWETDNHNIHVEEKPSASDWSGVEEIHNSGYTHSHTFTVTGEYHFWCVPHRNLGMVGDIVVEEDAPLPGQAPAGGGEVDPEEMGVPFQAHFVGLATIVGIVVSLVFTFFFLKYGETPHTGYPEEK